MHSLSLDAGVRSLDPHPEDEVSAGVFIQDVSLRYCLEACFGSPALPHTFGFLVQTEYPNALSNIHPDL